MDKHEKHLVDELNEQLRQGVITEMDPIAIEQIDFTPFEDMSEFVPYHPQAREKLQVRRA